MAAVVPGQPTAASAIAEHLSTPPTLTRIPLLQARIHKERTQLQSTLGARAKDQVDLVKQGLTGLRDAHSAAEQLKDSLREVQHLVADPRAHIHGFGKLVEVSVVHRRLTQTLEIVNSLRSMYARLSHLSDLLAADRADPLGPSPHLLPIHYHLTELETFRNETLAQAKKSSGATWQTLASGPAPANPDLDPNAAAAGASSTTRETLERYFERLGETIEAFEAHYFRLARQLLALARAGHSDVAVRLCKIAEVESARDQRALAIRMVKKAGNVDVAARFRSLQADARTLKHYRNRVLDAVRDGCRTDVEKSYRRADEDGVRWLDELDWLFDDIATVRELLVDKFPADWKIEEVYVKGYHKALYDFIATLVRSEPDPATLLRLSQFTPEYTKAMTQDLGVDPTWLEPPLLDGKAGNLIDSYLTVISKKMDEWTANLFQGESRDFLARAEPPETDPDGYYGMQGAVILFQMLNQQLDLALDSNQAAVLARVVDEANRVMRSVQRQWIGLVNAEHRRRIAGDETLVPGLDEYVMALANDQIKCADFTEALSNRLEPLVSVKYKGAIVDKLSDGMDGFLDVAKRCVQVLIDVVFHDLKPATKVLLSPAWQAGEVDPMRQIIETLQDYMDDYQVHLHPNLFELLVEDLLDTFLITYLVAVRRASKLRIPQSVDRMRADIDLAFGFFLAFKPKTELVAYFDVLESVLTLLSASKMMVFLDYWPFRKNYGPNLAFTEGLMKARDDLDRSAVNEIMDSIKRKVQSERVDDAPDQPSIFERMPPK